MKSILLFFLVLILNFSFSQNLVPNNSFETHLGCNSFGGTIKDSPPWFTSNYPNSVSFYFHPCSPFFFLYLSVPRNLTDTTGYQWPHSGNAYGGFNVYSDQNINYRQYVQVKLNDTLEMNRKYCVEFFVNLCNNSFYGTDGIGAYFSADTVTCVGFNCLMNVSPQIQSQNSVAIIDTLNWTKISGYFYAQGNEKYLTIGNFLQDSQITLGINNAILHNSSFYYIDDVSVTLCDSSSAIKELTGIQSIKVFPNPAKGFVTVSSEKAISEICLLDISGKLILKQSGGNRVDVTSIADGFYTLICKFEKGDLGYEKIVVQHER